MKNTLRIVAIAGVALALSACATALPNPAATPPSDIAGFWWGLWNGLTFPFAFIGSLFDSSIAIYHTPNNGGWYDFGFFLGVGGLSTGIARRSSED